MRIIVGVINFLCCLGFTIWSVYGFRIGLKAAKSTVGEKRSKKQIMQVIAAYGSLVAAIIAAIFTLLVIFSI